MTERLLRVRDILNGAFTWMCIAKRIGFNRDVSRTIGKMIQAYEKDLRIGVHRRVLSEEEEKKGVGIIKCEFYPNIRNFHFDIVVLRSAIAKELYFKVLVPGIEMGAMRVYEYRDGTLHQPSVEELYGLCFFEP